MILLLAGVLESSCAVGEEQNTLPVESSTGGALAIQDSMGNPLGAKASAIVLANREADAKYNLLARVESEPDFLVEFYEPTPGQILISTAGAPKTQPSYDFKGARRAPLDEVWRQVSHGAKMPAKLQDAWNRAKANPPTKKAGRHGAPAGATGEASSIQQAPNISSGRGNFSGLSSGSIANPGSRTAAAPPMNRTGVNAQTNWCDSTYLTTDWGYCGWDWYYCPNNAWNWAYAYHHDSEYNRSSVCAASGPVRLTITSDDDGLLTGTWAVPYDTARQVENGDYACTYWFNDCPYIRADVSEADGDRFHFRFLVLE